MPIGLPKNFGKLPFEIIKTYNFENTNITQCGMLALLEMTIL